MLKKIAKEKKVNLVIKNFSYKYIPALISAADLVLLTLSHEGLGIVLLEAMACGTPVIGTKVSGITEIIRDKYNGLLVNYGDVKNLAKAIQDCLENQSLRRVLIRGGHKTIAKKFNTQQSAYSHLKIYKNFELNFKNNLS